MVFSSVPVYLDPPNWHQQPVGGGESPHLPPPPPVGGGGGGLGSTTPHSMTERARLAKLPQPETALKCPRCESTNTKFCYFNNYNQSQPRHFCKTCRRYWTRGGALRNVPVGGGCRRNKRSKRNKPKSPISVDRQISAVSSNSCTTNMLGHVTIPPPQLPFYGNGNIDLNFREIQPDFQIGSDSSGNGPNLTSQFEQWRLEQVQQFPFLAGLESTAGIYQFEGEGVEPSDYTSHLEENQGLNLSRNFLGVQGNDDQYLGGNAWTTDLNGFTSSTSHLL